MAQSLLERGLRWHARELPDTAAVTVEIRDEKNAVIDKISAAPGRRDFEQYLVSEYAGTSEVFDWIVTEQDLIFSGRKCEPKEGWEVRYRKDDGTIAVFRAMPGSGTRVFDVVGQLGLLYRIHTKFDRIEQP